MLTTIWVWPWPSKGGLPRLGSILLRCCGLTPPMQQRAGSWRVADSSGATREDREPFPVPSCSDRIRADPVESKYSNLLSHWGLRLDHRPHFGLSSARPSRILSVPRDSKDKGEDDGLETPACLHHGLCRSALAAT